MMKKLTLVAGFLIVLGSSAITAHAQTPISADALVRIDDPFCTSPTATCVLVEYTGPTVIIEPPTHYFVLPVSDPPGHVPDPMSPDNINCGGDEFMTVATAITNGAATEFFGCLFSGGTLTHDHVYSFTDDGATSNIPFTLSNTTWKCAPGDSCSQEDMSISFTPEPSTSVLFGSGLLLFFLGGSVRKRLGTTLRT